ncbi:MAG: hypothetical protein WCX71_05225 [Candidatus Buchananbacteria bacterium]
MKKILLTLAAFFLFWPALVFAAESKPVTLTVFYGDGCPHCHAEFLYLDQLQKDFSDLQIRKMEVWYDTENASLMGEVGQKINAKNFGVPLTLVGTEAVIGYYNDEVTGQRIKDMVLACQKNGCDDFVGNIIDKKNQAELEKQKPKEPADSSLIYVPLVGTIDAAGLSLPVLTIVVGLLDGFNPCAMWILLFLISLLVGSQDRKRIWILGLTFILTGAISYYLIMAAWLNIFLFVGFIPIIRALVGIFAMGSGAYYIYKWWQQKKTCEAIDDKKRGRIMQKIKDIVVSKSYILAVFGIIALSISINLIELVCSAGLPAIYTQVLSISHLSLASYYLYLLFYVFFFILNQLIVFFVAALALKAFALSSKYARLMNFIGGMVIFILGILLIFRPQWIMFG